MIKHPLHEGYLAFCDKKPLDTESNPYDFIEEQEAHFDWIDGWRDAEKDFNRRMRNRKALKSLKAQVRLLFPIIFLIVVTFTLYLLGII